MLSFHLRCSVRLKCTIFLIFGHLSHSRLVRRSLLPPTYFAPQLTPADTCGVSWLAILTGPASVLWSVCLSVCLCVSLCVCVTLCVCVCVCSGLLAARMTHDDDARDSCSRRQSPASAPWNFADCSPHYCCWCCCCCWRCPCQHVYRQERYVSTLSVSS